ncbi:hypothetical protein ACSFA0_09695 [Variovorax sp. LT1P1]|uniref:hypothetical protein n=1 Tax=Variovorax sp. LT1P1 TaxID=3443730 RepID=UPI003F445F9F
MTKIVEALLIRYLSIAAWSSTFWFRAPSSYLEHCKIRRQEQSTRLSNAIGTSSV